MISGEFKAGVATNGRPRTTTTTTRRPVQLEPVPDLCPRCVRDAHRDNRTADCNDCEENR
ncbi:hypothetical protein GCM10011608_10570 [Micromonospora sonchi]|uniref:Uncharacterized protein n=1 Tax=Micromonospora sonchi TaxID=1763543 RepID=A0A917TMC0_9ACTN|nr:hypothetical protein [Micromonospora sonchi]GGM27633.1 hypothetical protein GCM10011608_10570 [Micromonospora sonchi]